MGCRSRPGWPAREGTPFALPPPVSAPSGGKDPGGTWISPRRTPLDENGRRSVADMNAVVLSSGPVRETAAARPIGGHMGDCGHEARGWSSAREAGRKNRGHSSPPQSGQEPGPEAGVEEEAPAPDPRAVRALSHWAAIKRPKPKKHKAMLEKRQQDQATRRPTINNLWQHTYKKNAGRSECRPARSAHGEFSPSPRANRTKRVGRWRPALLPESVPQGNS